MVASTILEIEEGGDQFNWLQLNSELNSVFSQAESKKMMRHIKELIFNKVQREDTVSSPVRLDKDSGKTDVNLGERKIESDLRKTKTANNDKLGGIDLNGIDVDRQGRWVDTKINPIDVQEMIDIGITGFKPVIINLTPLPSILPLLGLEPKKDEELELSQAN